MTRRAAVAHLTTVHPATDTRIVVRECRSLAAAGYEVHLVAPAERDAVVEGVRVHALPIDRERRAQRIARGLPAALARARAIDAALYHVHDAELLPVAAALTRRGKPVVYDVHEDLPRQVLTKDWIARPLRRAVSRAVEAAERRAVARMAGIVAATPAIERRFQALHPRTALVANFPLPDELVAPAPRPADARERVAYVGGITEVRGIRPIMDAIERTDARLLLVGPIWPDSLARELRRHPAWGQVDELGVLGRDAVAEVLGRAVAGLLLYLPAPNHVDALPNKLFEYMSAGIPVIASDFPAWRGLVDEHGCGICVDPRDPDAIAAAIRDLTRDPRRAAEMGAAGRRAVETRFNWSSELAKLLALYEDVLGRSAARHATK